MAYQSIWAARQTEILACAEWVKAEHPYTWQQIQVPGQTSRAFIGLVAARCQALVSGDIGCNLKRGGPEVSIDVLAMPNASGADDSTHHYAGLELVDIVGGAEGPSPSLIWGDVTQATISGGSRGYIPGAAGTDARLPAVSWRCCV